MKRFAILSAAACFLAAASAVAAPRHGISVFGDLKYPADFRHFEYANPNAPKGGAMRVYAIDTFETVNPFILKGRKEELAEALLFDTLMTPAQDEPDSLYALVAESVETEDGLVAFNIDPRARFHDGSSIRAEDVAFTFDMLREKGHPQYGTIYRDVERAAVAAPLRVEFVFKPGKHRDLPTRLAALPVLSKAYYADRKFDETTFEAPLASGPYKVARLDPGRSIAYARVPDYWARDLPVNRGRYNFDEIVVEYFRDREVAFQAFFAKEYDFREEFTSRQWATQYDEPPVRKGLIVRETLPDETPSGVQAFILNLRRGKFADVRVRHAIDLAFDFEWTNKTLFFSLYERTNSMFENSDLAARRPPSDSELALLEPWRGKVPDEVFAAPFRAPVTDGSGRVRKNLRKAARLLKEAGWRVENGVLKNAAGEPLTIEFLLFEASFNRIVNPYIANLKRLGIQASIRIVDAANFKRRTDSFDFDIVIRRIAQPLTPGLEQRGYFGSPAAEVPGSFNIGGISDPAVDALIEEVVAASSRAELTTAVRALDRVLTWNRYVVTQWYKGEHNIAYWNKFGRPAVSPKFGMGVLDTWWYDREKAATIAQGNAPPRPPGALPPP